MKKLFSNHVCRILMLCVILLASVLLGRNAQINAAETLTPHILSTGDTQDLREATTYKFQSDGSQLFRIVIPENGALCMELHSAEAQTVIAELYQNVEMSDLPIYLQAQCSVNNGKTDTIRRYFDKGTYYIRFPKNDYEASLLLYPRKNMSIKDKSLFAAYCDYTHENTYTFKAAKNGYLSVFETSLVDNGGTVTSVLCNAKGKILTEKAFFNNLQNNQVTYAVKKGLTYKLKIKALDTNDTQYYQLSFKHAAIKEKSGASKKKAVKIKFGDKVSGTVYAEESASKADWYKITNARTQQLILNFSGNITSGSMVFDVFDSKGHKVDSYSVISNIGEKHEYQLHNGKKGTQMLQGTYYLRITKSRKTSTGVYKFSLSGK